MTVNVPDPIYKDICLEYINGMAIKDLQELFGYSRHTITQIVKKSGLPMRGRGGARTIDEWNYYEIYDMYSSGFSVTDICDKKDLQPGLVQRVVQIVQADPYKYELLRTQANKVRAQ